MILLIYASSQIVGNASYSDIENEDIRSKIDIALNQIDYYLSTLDRNTVDYACWDDTYWYAMSGGPDSYIESNYLDTTMINQELSLVAIVNASDQVIYARGYDLEKSEDAPVPEGFIERLNEGSLLRRVSAASGFHGIMMLPAGPLMISACPITKSDGGGEEAGVFFMGRFLSDAEVDAIGNMCGISIGMHPYSEAGMPEDFEPAMGMAASGHDVIIEPVDGDRIRGYALIKDVYDNPALVISVEEPRTVYQQSKSAMVYTVASLLITGLVFSIVVILSLEKMVISRMIRLNKSVGRIGLDTGTSARVPVDGDDEVAELASTINHTLDALEASRRQLQDNEERLRSMVENINEVVWETDAAMKLTYVSPKAGGVFGYASDELLGRSPFDLVKPEERGHIQSTIHDMNVRNDSFAGVEFWITRSDGTQACIEVGGNVIRDPAGKITGYRGIARDVSERRRADETLRVSEERLRLSAATARFGTIDWDLVNDRQVWSPETYEIFGLPQGTPLTFDCWNSLIYPGDRLESFVAVMLDPAGPGEHAKEFRIVRASDGSIRWVFSRVSIFFEGEGDGRRAVRVLGAVQDITDRKHAEEAMAASLDEKDVLLKEIHHRVKNNLQIISSLLSLQSGTVKGENQATMFRESQDRIRSMALIHEKLYQSKDISRIDFAGYVRSLITYLMHSYAAGRGVHVIIDIENVLLGIDTAIPCGLIINELVSNSFKYAFRDGRPGELRIGLAWEGDRYVLVVSDNGVGFPPGLDFRNTDSLGLQLVNTLVGQLEGTIELDTARGTRFKITFAENK